MSLGVIAGMVAGATGIGDKGVLGAATVGIIEVLEQELKLSDLIGVCSVDPVSINFQFMSKTGGAGGQILLADETGDEFKITSLSQENYY